MFIRQISVYLENVHGTLQALTQLLGEHQINLLAISIADASGFGIIRCIVKSGDEENTLRTLKENGYIAKANRVICVRLPHKPMALANVLQSLEEEGLSVEYAYSFVHSNRDDALILLRPSDVEAGEQALTAHGAVFVSQEEVDAF